LSADATLAIADGKADRFRASELAAKDLPSEEKASQDERLGAGAGAARVWALRPEPERTLANLVTDLQAANIEANQWGKVLDAVEVSEDLFVLGRIDISRASEGILATLPGVTAEVASNLVRVRSTLDESGRRDLAWPVVSGAVDAKAFAGFVDLITTRSLQYRVRVEAGRTTRSDATGVESDQFGVASSTEASLTDRCVLEAVIDVAGEQPRIAYLRDITLLGSATMVAEAVASTQPESLGATRGLEVIPEGANSEFVAAEPSEGVQGQGDAEPDNGLQTDGLERSGGLDLGGGIDRSATEVNLDSRIEPEVPASSSEPQNSSTETRTSPLTTSGVRADPRLGRWNAGSLGASKGASKGSSPSPSVGDDSGTTAANDGASSVTGRDAAKSTSKSSASAKRVPSKGSNGAGATKKKSPARKEGAQ
jgi:hypothetical protein